MAGTSAEAGRLQGLADPTAAASPPPKKGEAKTQQEDDNTESGWSARTLWRLFVAGFLLPPCWWAVVAAGLRSGGRDECLMRRRRRQSASQVGAWRASLAMSLVSVLVLILVLAIFYGQRSPPRDGPYFVTLAGPAAAFPDLSDASKLALVASALHGALQLPDAYAASNIAVYVDRTAALPAATATRRRLLQGAAGERLLIVLGYTLRQAHELPPPAQLHAAMALPGTTTLLAEQLSELEFVAPSAGGQLSVSLTSSSSSEEVASQLAGSDVLLQALAPIGRPVACAGAWSAWGACSAACGNGTSTRTFAVTTPATLGGAACPAANGAVETAPCFLQPCCDLGWQAVPDSCNASCEAPQGFILEVFNASLAGDADGACGRLFDGWVDGANRSTVTPCAWTQCCSGWWYPTGPGTNDCFANNTRPEVFRVGPLPTRRHLLAPQPCGFEGATREAPVSLEPGQACCSAWGQYFDDACNATACGQPGYFTATYRVPDDARQWADGSINCTGRDPPCPVANPRGCVLNGSTTIEPCTATACSAPLANCSGTPGAAFAVDAWTCATTAHNATCSAACNATQAAAGSAVASCSNGTYTLVQACTALTSCAGPPDQGPNTCGAAYDCTGSVASGTVCTATCPSVATRRSLLVVPAGEPEQVNATCDNGVYQYSPDPCPTCGP